MRDLFSDLAKDCWYLVRSARRNVASTVAAVLTLALGIGMTTAVFSIVHGVLLRPLPFEESDRLVMLHTVMEGEGRTDRNLSPPNFASIKQANRSFSEVAAFTTTEHTLIGVGEAQKLDSARVSAEFFDLLRVRPALGRTFAREENETGREHVVVLSHVLWQQQFGGNPAVIGESIRLDGTPHVVVGVAPAGFDFPNKRALWVPQVYGRVWSVSSLRAASRIRSCPYLPDCVTTRHCRLDRQKRPISAGASNRNFPPPIAA